MKLEVKRNCGRQVPASQESPAQEVLNEQGEIFSCGGVYLGTNRVPSEMGDEFSFLHLPNHRKQTIVMNHQRPFRLPGEPAEEGELATGERPSAESAIRRFFKESLN